MIDAEKELTNASNKALREGIDKLVLDAVLRPPAEDPVDRWLKGPVEVTKTTTLTIERCFHTCPYFELDGGPGPVMYCEHPEAPDQGYIISHPACDEGFPLRCPLFVNKEKT